MWTAAPWTHSHDQSLHMRLTPLSESMYRDKKMTDELDGRHGLMNEVCGDIGSQSTDSKCWNSDSVMKYVADKSLELSN